MSEYAQGFDIPLASPFAQFIVLTGIVADETGFGSEHLETFDARYNLSKRHHSILSFPLSPKTTRVTAAVGLSSINNSEYPQWTWAVNKVTHEISDDGQLWLNITIAGQGGSPESKGWGGTPGIIYVGDVIGALNYSVIVQTLA